MPEGTSAKLGGNKGSTAASLFLPLVRYICLFFLGGAFSMLTEPLAENLFRSLHPGVYTGPFDIDLTGIGILIGVSIFMIPIFLVLFGDKYRYIVTTIFILPLVFFTFYDVSDGSFIFFPMHFFSSPLVLAGYGVITGILLRYLSAMFFSNMPQFSSWKRYF